MKHSRFFRLSLVLVLSALALPPLMAQEKIQFPALSQRAVLKQRVGLTDVEIDYARPNKKEREIFGGLVPYGKMWRTGANAPTKIKFSDAVMLEGKEIPAGEYVLLTIPAQDQWTIIVSKDAKMESPNDYKQENDAARLTVKPTALPMTVETFTIGFDDIAGASATLHMDWDKTRVPIKFTTDDVEQVSKKLASAQNLEPGQAFQAAVFYYENDKDLNQAAKWIDQAVEKNPDAWFMQLRKAQIHAKLGKKEEATAAAQKTIELLKKDESPDEASLKLAQKIVDESK